MKQNTTSMQMKMFLTRLGENARMIITGDRAILGDRIASCFARKFVLRLNDANDYRMADINPRVVPPEMPPGRAIECGSLAEVQFVVLAQSNNHADELAELQRIACSAASAPGSAPLAVVPFRVDALPEFVAVDDSTSVARHREKSEIEAKKAHRGCNCTGQVGQHVTKVKKAFCTSRGHE